MNKGYAQNQLDQIILALDFTTLKFNAFLTINIFEIQPNNG